MAEHLTRQSPSWRNWFLNKLGWTDLPTPVTCWYCNQKMYLLPGSRHTERMWYCNLCENTNAIDEFGDIMDAPPLPDTGVYSVYGSSLARQTNRQQSAPSAKLSTQRTLCNNCQRNQTLIYQIMSDYIRDENDPDYEYYVKTADEYQQSLHNKYPLCDACQEKIQVIVAEQRGHFRRRRINEQRQRSLQSKTPTRLTAFQYQLQGSLWFILHGSVLFLCIYAICYPPQPLEDDTAMVMDARNCVSQMNDVISAMFHHREDDQPTVISLMSSSSTLSNRSHILHTAYDALLNIFWYIMNDFSDMILFTARASYLVLSSSTYIIRGAIPLLEEYHWNVTDMGIICYLLFYTISVYFMNWHIRASRTFLELSKPRHLKTYKIVQRFLYFYRFVLLYSLAFMSTLKKSSLCLAFACSYILLLVWSVLHVQLKKSKSNEWPEKIVGKSDKVQQQHHPEHAPSSRLSQSSPFSSSQSMLQPSSGTLVPNHRHMESAEQTKSAWYDPWNFVFKQQHLESRDAEVDGLTAELGRISV